MNYVRRYDAGHIRARECLRDGAIGKVQRVRGIYTKGLLHNGTHMIDLLRWLFGEPVRGASRPAASGVVSPGDSSVDFELEFGDGTHASIIAADARSYSVFELDILGTKGRLELMRSGNEIRLSASEASRRYPGFKDLGKPVMLTRGMRHSTYCAVDDLLACLERRRREPACSGRDGLNDLSIAQQLLAASGRKRWVPIRSERNV